ATRRASQVDALEHKNKLGGFDHDAALLGRPGNGNGEPTAERVGQVSNDPETEAEALEAPVFVVGPTVRREELLERRSRYAATVVPHDHHRSSRTGMHAPSILITQRAPRTSWVKPATTSSRPASWLPSRSTMVMGFRPGGHEAGAHHPTQWSCLARSTCEYAQFPGRKGLHGGSSRLYGTWRTGLTGPRACGHFLISRHFMPSPSTARSKRSWHV